MRSVTTSTPDPPSTFDGREAERRAIERALALCSGNQTSRRG
jgi:hypothetical protein